MEFPVEYIEFAEAYRCRWYETYLESNMYDMHVVVPADKAPNNIILIYEKHYKNWPPRYNWNIVQRCVKHHNPPSTLFYLYVYFVISIQGFYRTWASRWMSYKKQELLTLRKPLVHHCCFGGIGVAHSIIFLCCVFCCCVRSLVFPFVISPSVFSNVYVIIYSDLIKNKSRIEFTEKELET